MADTGMRFERAMLTISSCSPSRSSIITGRYPRGLIAFVGGAQRWAWRGQAYAFVLATDKYPPFSLN